MKLHEYVEWMREDLAYKAPETWPGVVTQHLSHIAATFPNVEAVRAGPRSDCACGQTVDVEGDLDADGDKTVYVEGAGFWHRSCRDVARAMAADEAANL